ncbi:hypothetical protein [Cohnella soli]|uniref:Uncharacterized protein n=1 Tax=Cohnella soli TaxID=425005 RepID=A0ABW0HS58_9BACL
MGSFFDDGPLPDWKDLQSWLKKEIPWNLAENLGESNGSNWIEQYVQNMLLPVKNGARLHANAIGKGGAGAEALVDVKRNAKTLIVRVRFAPNVEMRHVQMHVTSERLKITGLPDGGRKIVRFPCLVLPRSGSAVMNDNGTVEIRLKRKPPDKSEYELFIRQ